MSEEAKGKLIDEIFMPALSRKDEFEADEFAIRYVKKAGFDIAGFFQFADRLARMGDSKVSYYLLSHPQPSSRRKMAQLHLISEGRLPARVRKTEIVTTW